MQYYDTVPRESLGMRCRVTRHFTKNCIKLRGPFTSRPTAHTHTHTHTHHFNIDPLQQINFIFGR